MQRRYGVLRVYSEDIDSQTAYIFSYPEDADIYKLVEEALREIRADKEIIDSVIQEYGYGSVRDLCCELPDEPFNRRGITFVPVMCDYEIDGDERLDEDEEGGEE
jgi:hypothetical protein